MLLPLKEPLGEGCADALPLPPVGDAEGDAQPEAVGDLDGEPLPDPEPLKVPEGEKVGEPV